MKFVIGTYWSDICLRLLLRENTMSLTRELMHQPRLEAATHTVVEKIVMMKTLVELGHPEETELGLSMVLLTKNSLYVRVTNNSII